MAVVGSRQKKNVENLTYLADEFRRIDYDIGILIERLQLIEKTLFGETYEAKMEKDSIFKKARESN